MLPARRAIEIRDLCCCVFCAMNPFSLRGSYSRLSFRIRFFAYFGPFLLTRRTSRGEELADRRSVNCTPVHAVRHNCFRLWSLKSPCPRIGAERNRSDAISFRIEALASAIAFTIRPMERTSRRFSNANVGIAGAPKDPAPCSK